MAFPPTGWTGSLPTRGSSTSSGWIERTTTPSSCNCSWDYQFNLDGYPAFQEYFRTHQPPLLVTWGKNDEIFGAPGAEAFRRDFPNGEFHLLDAGHFALETHGEEISGYIRDFLGRVIVAAPIAATVT